MWTDSFLWVNADVRVVRVFWIDPLFYDKGDRKMIKDLLKREEYKIVDKKLDEYYSEFEELYSYGFVGAYMFDDLKKELGRIPSQYEFVKEGLTRAEEFFLKSPRQWLSKSRKNYYFNWDSKLINSVENRLSRSYFSFVLEEQVAEFVKARYGAKTTSNSLIDVVFGSDVTFVLDDKIYYIHITKNNRWSSELLTSKGKKSVYVVDEKGQKRYWKRDWKNGHHVLTYNNRSESRMTEVNGNLLFEEAYLENWFDKMFEKEKFDSFNGKSELLSFYEYLNRFNLVEGEVKSA